MIETIQKWKIGDCLKLLPEIENESIDLILTDLPYGVTACSWDTIIPFEALWEQYKRIIKDNGAIVLFGTQPFTSKLIVSNIEMFKYEWIWYKNMTSGFALAKKQPLRNHENIVVFYKNQPTYNPIKELRDMNENSKKRMEYDFTTSKGNNVQQKGLKKVQFIPEDKTLSYPKTIKKTNGVNSHNRLHPTQKPVELIEYLVETYTNPGDIVHDSCLGSGTTLEACVNLNRNCIGFEISLEWEWNYREIMDKKKNMYKLSKMFGKELS